MKAASQPAWTIVALLRWTADYLGDKGVLEPRSSAEVLLAHVLNLSRLDLYLRYDQPLSPEELASFKSLVVRRRQGEPVAYLTGHKEFWSLDFQVRSGVLIPRPETEILVASALEAARTMIGLELEGQEPQKFERQKKTVEAARTQTTNLKSDNLFDGCRGSSARNDTILGGHNQCPTIHFRSR